MAQREEMSIPPGSAITGSPVTARERQRSPTVESLQRQRPWVFIATGVAVAVVMGVVTAVSRASVAPGFMIGYWAVAMAVAWGIIHLAYSRAIALARRLQYLSELVAPSASHPYVHTVLETVGQAMRDLFRLEMAGYQLYADSSPGVFTVFPETGLDDRAQGTLRAVLRSAAEDPTPTVRVLRQGDMGPEEQALAEALEAKTLVLTSFVSGGRTVAVACFYAPWDRFFGRSDLEYMEVLAGRAADVLRTSFLEQRGQDVLRQIAAYNEMASAMTEGPDLMSALRVLVGWAVGALSADLAVVALRKHGDEGGGYAPVSWAGPWELAPDEREQLLEAVATPQVVAREAPYLAARVVGDGLSRLEELGVRSLMIAPLRALGETLGAVVALRGPDDRPFNEADLERLSTMTNQAAVIIANVHLYELERDRVRELEELSNFKSGLLYNLSHELRTSLAALKAAAEMLLGEEGVQPGTDYYTRLLHSIVRNVARQETLVSSIVDMASLENRTLTLTPELVNVHDVVAEACSLVTPLVNQRQQTLTVSVPRDLPPLIADRHRLVQVLVNLLANAHKYSPEGSEIRLSVEARDGQMVFTVSDSGPGIPPEERERVFEAFYRIQRGSDVGVPGSGLGLAIAKSLVELHGGRIWVEDGPLGGASFVFSLPLEEVNESSGNR